MEEKGRQGSKRREFCWYHRETIEDEDEDDWGCAKPDKVHKRGVQTLKVDPQDESWSPAGHATVVLGRLPQRN